MDGQRTTLFDEHAVAGVPVTARQGLLEQAEGLRALLEQAPTGLVVAEAPSGRIVVFNEEATRILGHAIIPADRGTDYANYGAIHVDGTPYEPSEHPLARALAGEIVRDQTVRYRRGDGTTVRLSVGASPVRACGGQIIGAVTTFIDTTERYLLETRVRRRLERLVEERALQASERTSEFDRLNASLRAISDGLEEKVRQRTAELAYQAQHDHLTGLPNRVLFEERLERAVASAERYGRRLALLFFDLDGFKLVNDTFGHDVGDRVLKELGQRLRTCLRRSDTLARYGGDEFVVLVSEIKEADDAREVALALLSTLVEPFEVPGDRAVLSASIGVSIYPDDAEDASKLRRHADAAMYGAKTTGGAGIVIYGAGARDEPFAVERQGAP